MLSCTERNAKIEHKHRFILCIMFFFSFLKSDFTKNKFVLLRFILFSVEQNKNFVEHRAMKFSLLFDNQFSLVVRFTNSPIMGY